MFERSIGVRLNLLADFAKTSGEVINNLRSIGREFEELKKIGSVFDLGRFQQISRELSLIQSFATNAAAAGTKLNTSLEALSATARGTLTTDLNAAGRAVFDLGEQAKVAQGAVGGIGAKAESTGKKAKAAAADAMTAAKDIASGMEGAAKATRSMGAAVDAAVISVGALGGAMLSEQAKLDRTIASLNEATAAARRLESALLSLRDIRPPSTAYPPPFPSAPQLALPAAAVMGMLTGARRAALPTGTMERYMLGAGIDAAAWGAGGGGRIPPRMPPDYPYDVPGFYPSEPGRLGPAPTQYALPGGRSDRYYRFFGGDRTAEGWGAPPINYARSFDQQTMGGSSFDWATRAQLWATQGGHGAALMGLGDRTMRAGDRTQSAGMSGIVNFAMIAGLLGPMIQTAANFEDIQGKSTMALSSMGMSAESAANFQRAIINNSRKIGGDVTQQVAGIYDFASAVPGTIKMNPNDPKVQEKLEQAYTQMLKVQIVSSTNLQNASVKDMTLGNIAAMRNLGLKMQNVDDFVKGTEYMTNAIIQLKNKTAADPEQIINAVRAVGPIAANMGVSPDDIMGMIGIMAENKVVGATAGQNIKRFFSRETLPTPKTMKMQDLIHSLGGNINLFDQQGATRPLFSVLGDISDFLTGRTRKDHKPLTQQAQAEVLGQMMGLYALPSMAAAMDLIKQFGGGKESREWAQRTLYTPPASAKPGQSALDADFAMRQDFVRAQQGLKNAGMASLVSTFKLMEPDLIKVLDSLTNLLKSWDDLSDSTKKSALEMTGWITIGSGALGILGVLGGNFIKLGGAIISVGGALVKGTEFLMGWGSAGKTVTGFFEGIVPRAIAFVGALDLIPVAIVAIPIALIALTTAWQNNWLNIQGVTKSALAAIKNILGGLAQDAGFALASFQVAWNNWFATHNLGKEILKALSIKDDLDKQMLDAGASAASSLIKGIFDHLKGIPQWLLDRLQQGKTQGLAASGALDAGPAATGYGYYDSGTAPDVGSYGDSGKAAGEMFAKSFGRHLATQGKAAVQQGLEPIGAQFPHSEPKDASSPLHGMEQSGEATANMYFSGLITGLFRGSGHVKKAAKPIADAFLELKTESVAQVEETAQRIEASLKAAGAVIKDRWIDLFNPKTGTVTRVQGDLGAYRAALGTTQKDTSDQRAHDYLEKIQREIKAGVPVDVSKALEHLELIGQHALSEHAMNVIFGYLDKLRTSWNAYPKKVSEEFSAAIKKFESELMTVGAAGDRYDLTKQRGDEAVQRATEAIKDTASPTSKELNKIISAERSEHDSLANALLAEEESYKRLTVARDELAKKIKELNGADAAQKAMIDQLQPQLDQMNQEYDAAGSRIRAVQNDVVALNTAIAEQTEKIKEAKDTWRGLINDVFQKSTMALQNSQFKSIADHVQNYFQLQNSGNGLGANNFARHQANDFANNVFQQLFQGIFDESATSKLEWFHRKGNAKTGVPAINIPEQKVNSLLDKVDKTTTYTAPLGNIASIPSGGGAPLPVAIMPKDGGGQDIGASLLDATTGGAKDTTDQLQKMQDTLSTGAMNNMSVPDTKTSLDNFKNTANKIGEAYSLYQGLQSGGIGGGVQAGMSAYEMTGNPYIAGAMAILGFIGIGPHETKLQQPDLNDQQWQQLLPNLMGTNQQLGDQVIEPQLQYSQYAGNQNLAQQLYSYLSNPAALVGQNPQMVQTMQRLLQLSGGSPTGLEVKSENQGTATLMSGQKISVTDLETLINTVGSAMSVFQNSMLTQAQNADRLAASFTTRILGGPAGFVMPEFGGAGGANPAAGGPMLMPTPANTNQSGFRQTLANIPAGAIQGVGAGTTGNGTMQVQISILQGAQVHTTADVNNAVNQALPRIIQAVYQANYNNQRTSGTYISPTS